MLIIITMGWAIMLRTNFTLQVNKLYVCNVIMYNDIIMWELNEKLNKYTYNINNIYLQNT